MKFCSDCGSDQIKWQVPDDDTRNRHICGNCNMIFYSNPKVITGCLTLYKEKVLLCKRGIIPRHGFWTLPAGFMENGETIQEGAERETFEEAEARVDVDGIYTIFNLPELAQVHIFFRGQVINGDFGVGQESTDAKLYAEKEIPWDELAFPTITKTLKLYFEDRKKGDFPLRIEEFRRHK